MTTDEPTAFGPGVPSTGELHAALATEEHRRVLRFFLDRERSVATVDDLADHLTNRVGRFETVSEARIVLHHNVLPKLAETGAIDYDHRTHVTRFRGHARLEALLPQRSTA